MLKEINLFIFDLDGTLIDSREDITDSVNYTMTHFGLPLLPNETILEYVGNGVTPLIRKSFEIHMDGVSFEEALETFKAHYDQHLLDKTRLFPGVMKVLCHFAPHQKVILTNKSQGYADKIIKGLQIDHLFDEVLGGDTEHSPKPAPDVIHYLLEKFDADPKKTVIVGDIAVDLQTGQNAGILTCAATYGFRPRKELEQTGYDYLIESPGELIAISG